jgi:hypothetical protein
LIAGWVATASQSSMWTFCRFKKLNNEKTMNNTCEHEIPINKDKYEYKLNGHYIIINVRYKKYNLIRNNTTVPKVC